MAKEKKIIQYYGIKAEIDLYDFSNRDCFTQKELYLGHKILRKRFKTIEQAREFFDKIKLK